MIVGQRFALFVNQGIRNAEVLAKIDQEILVEYEMPQGSTALRIVHLQTNAHRNVSYFRVPTRWLRALVDQGASWNAHPQQTSKIVPAPEKLYAERMA